MLSAVAREGAELLLLVVAAVAVGVAQAIEPALVGAAFADDDEEIVVDRE